MKVLHVIPSVSPTQGGPSRAIVDMERALAARGLDITTITTDDDGDAGRLQERCGAPVTGPDSTRWYFRRDTRFYKFSAGLGGWLARNVRCFDVVHAHALFSFAPLAAGSFARQAGVPYVLRPLGVLSPYGMKQRRFLKRLSFDVLERPLLKAAGAVHFTSRSEADQAQALGLQCRSVVIPLAVDAAFRPVARKAARPGGLDLLFLSRLDPKKNLEGLLRGMSLAIGAGADIRLQVAGAGDPTYVVGLKQLAADLGLAGRVSWLGHVDGPRKVRAFADADAYALPSYSENFGISVVEALAAGLPSIVSSDVAVQDEIVAAGAGLSVGTDAESLALAIRRLASDAPALNAMSRAATRLAADSFSKEAMGQRLEALYRDLVEAHAMTRAA